MSRTRRLVTNGLMQPTPDEVGEVTGYSIFRFAWIFNLYLCLSEHSIYETDHVKIEDYEGV